MTEAATFTLSLVNAGCAVVGGFTLGKWTMTKFGPLPVVALLVVWGALLAAAR